MSLVEKVLAEFERRTKTIPIGHEDRGRGSSSYNWRMAHLGELRKIASELGVLEPSAWLIRCRGPGKGTEYATVDPEDNQWWPKDQWTLVTSTALHEGETETIFPPPQEPTVDNRKL